LVARSLSAVTACALLLARVSASSGDGVVRLPRAIVDASSSARIVVGPDITVDQEPDTVFAEPVIAARTRDSKELVAASMSFGPGSWNGRIFVSRDGGYTWLPSIPPTYFDDLGDVQLDYASDGSALFAALGSAPNAKHPGAIQHGLYLLRSNGDERRWEPQVFLQRGYDHEQLLVDHTFGRYRGRIYLFALYSSSKDPDLNELGLLRSTDGGRTILGPVRVVTGWNFNSNLAIFSDGTLFIPYEYTKGHPGSFDSYSTLKFVTSSDGGVSMSQPHTITRRYSVSSKARVARQRSGAVDWDLDSVPRFAIDTNTKRFSNRIYSVWSDMRFQHSRVLFSYSTDRGASWTRPRLIASQYSAGASQYQPCIAVSNTGVLGVSWFDTARSASQYAYNEYFTASRDGGKSFLEPVRVSSAPSHPLGRGNAAFSPAGSDLYKGSLYVFLTAAIGRFPSGGDYMGLTADSSGAFHPLWTDARDGIFQLRTATVMIRVGPKQMSRTMPQQVTDRLALSFDRSTWDTSRKIISLPVRLRNISATTLYGPFVTTVSLVRLPDADPYETATILNATNHKTGIGATFYYSTSSLPPNSVSKAIIWKIKVQPFSGQPTVAVKVQGYVKE